MKNIISAFFLLALSSTQAQNVSDFKYVIVPQTFTDFDKNDYRLNIRLRTYLKRKNYEVISEGVTAKPAELQSNPCLASRATIQNVKSPFKNKLKVVFTDCNNQEIGAYEGVSKIKEFEEGYQEALELASNKIANQNAKAIPFVNQNENITKSAPVVVDTTKKVEVESTNKLYQNEGKVYQVATTSNGAFLLISQEDTKVVAKFNPSSMANVYHVEVITPQGNYKTMGYIDENSITIDHQSGNNTWKKTIYSK